MWIAIFLGRCEGEGRAGISPTGGVWGRLRIGAIENSGSSVKEWRFDENV